MRPKVTRIQQTLREANVDAAILSSTPSVAYASGYVPSWEMWPGYNPYVPEPVVCCVWPDREPTLVLPDYYERYGEGLPVDVAMYSTYSYTQPIDQMEAVSAALRSFIGGRVRIGYEPRSLPVGMRDGVDAEQSSSWIDIATALERARTVKFDDEVAAVRSACEIADLVQQTVKERAEPGAREIDVAAEAVARSWEAAGCRFAILLQLSAGDATAAMGGWEPGERRLTSGDLVCTDTAPWLRGYWSDTCNAVVVGEPTARHTEMFELVNRALHVGIEAARPGVEARIVDAACRSVVQDAGYDYPHHSGHGLGLAHTEPPRITPDSGEVIEEGMVLALEPGVYIDGWGGFRHEHVFRVGAERNDVLTRFKHTL
jgi:Xaa-Pro aminopeptidase